NIPISSSCGIKRRINIDRFALFFLTHIVAGVRGIIYQTWSLTIIKRHSQFLTESKTASKGHARF
ncbi:MAG: hypothetical protein J6T83_05495, partial [Paludibacteraceae bacterium]|nr:hypothetical protein [Paludibacteraceae bacterium]